MENKNNRNHILVVDDDDRIRELLKEYVTEENYLISTSNNAENAKQKIEMIKFDIIILDIMMPGQSGLDLTHSLREKINTPIIINAANEILVDQYLMNKITFNSIYKHIMTLLNDRNYKKYAVKQPKNIKQVLQIDLWSRKTTLKRIK